MDEAAGRVPCSRRWLQKFLADNPADTGGNPFYFAKGNRKLFTEADIERIRQFTREAVRCQLSSSRRVRLRNRQAGTLEAPISESLWTEAQKLLKDESRTSSSSDGERKSNVVLIRTRGPR